MKVLLAPTEDFIKRERAQLTADSTSGNNVTFTVGNSNNINVNDFIVVGVEGSEGAEMCQVSAVTPQSITVLVCNFTHKSGEPITKYRYNKRKFYGATSATGSYSELITSGSPVTIQVDDPQGTFCEYTGLEGYTYFKSTYFNSSDSTETDIADALPVLADESIRYTSIYNIKKQAGLTNNPYITDGIVETYRKRAENEVKSYIMQRYILPLPEVPGIIENCTCLLAAGYMDYQEFGAEGEGKKWLGEARAVLKAIQNGTQRLLDSNDQELPFNSTSNQVQSFPDQVDNDNGPVQMFTTRQRF